MVWKADAMSTVEPHGTDEAWHLLRKIFLLLLVVTATALGLVLLSRQSSNLPTVLFNILADASLGLLVGLATRFVLRDRNTLIQGLASAAISLVGLAVLGSFTGWQSGIGPFQSGWVRVHWLDGLHVPLSLPLQVGASAMNVLDLVHAVIAVDTSWIALRVWKQGPRVTGRPSSPSPRVRRAPRPRTTEPEPAPIVPAVAPAPKRPASSGSSSASRARIRRKKAERALVAKPSPAIRPVRSRPRRSTSRHSRPAVHLAVHEEHRCPYCLEPVKRNDPRGTVECPICHTLHHKDCWDITGNCQVPHLTTL